MSSVIVADPLTVREIQVLKLIATGLSTKQIAATLGITFKTAACHRWRIMDKLGIHEVANLTRYAIRQGYVDASDNSRARETQEDLFQQVRRTDARYQQAVKDYAGFLRERETLGLGNPDGSTGARRLREAEHLAYQQYHEALVALKDFLLPD